VKRFMRHYIDKSLRRAERNGVEHYDWSLSTERVPELRKIAPPNKSTIRFDRLPPAVSEESTIRDLPRSSSKPAANWMIALLEGLHSCFSLLITLLVRLVLGTSAEWVCEVCRIALRKPVKVQSTRKPDRILLGELARSVHVLHPDKNAHRMDPRSRATFRGRAAGVAPRRYR
jgi:hypothetical protein